MTIKVTVEDVATGDTETREITDNVMVIVEGSAHVAGIQNFPTTGIQVWTIKGLRGQA